MKTYTRKFVDANTHTLTITSVGINVYPKYHFRVRARGGLRRDPIHQLSCPQEQNPYFQGIPRVVQAAFGAEKSARDGQLCVWLNFNPHALRLFQYYNKSILGC